MSSSVEAATNVRPFQIEFPGEQLDDLARRIANVSYFNEADKGGHFAAWEEPELFSQEVRAAFRSSR